ncbi:MAG: 30S ribosomal protein S15, partial [Methanimicrococcus sp.]|nr:30S ribosomal protein S15 [Methanimicrococcus sp.]
MAKMHTRRKGQSGSKKPYRTEVPEWVNVSADETKQLILDMWKQGISTSQIGMTLRDQYGIGDVKLITGQKITEILKENNVAPRIPEDIANLIIKALKL